MTHVLKLILKLAIVLLLATVAATVLAAETTEAPTEEKPTTVEGLIRYHAARHSVSAEDMLAVARCESNLNPNATGDLSLGVSRGIFQISRRWHPDVSDAEAYDPDFAAEWTARKFAAGKQGLWSCSRIVGII